MKKDQPERRLRKLAAGGGSSAPGDAAANLILVGTVHGDPRGYHRAWKVLEHFRPEFVTVEISRFSLRYRRRQGPRWQRLLGHGLAELAPQAAEKLAIQRLAAQVALPFEVRAARDWSRRRGVPWRPLDLGALARRHLPGYARDLLTPGNLQALLACTPDGSLEDFVAAEFRRARLAYLRSPWRLVPPHEAETSRRERFLAQRLRHLAGHGRVVHLGGWEHLVPWRDGGGLWHRLQDMEPLRLLLSEADSLEAGRAG